MKKIFVVIIAVCYSFLLVGQTAEDALNLSLNDPMGSARFMGVSGAFGAVGGDFSALSTNPASIALYKRSAVSLTPMVLSFNSSYADYNGSQSFFPKTRYTFTSFGMVFPIKGSQDWNMVQLGFGYNRTMDFNRVRLVEGNSLGSSIGQYWADIANSGVFTEEIDFAQDANLILLRNGSYSSPSANMVQKYISERKGGIDEMVFSLGGNWKDKLYVGATLGVPFLGYEEYSCYKEQDVNDEIGNFSYITYNDELKMGGVGVNLKLGLLYQPVNFFRFGAAFHTPTYYPLVRYSFTRQMTSENVGDIIFNDYRFCLRTPMRLMVNTAFLINRRAFVSAEYEFADYATSRLSPNSIRDAYSFSQENSEIRNIFNAVHIARIGAEVNLTQIFQLRAGYKLQTSPYEQSLQGACHSVSAGLGLRYKYFAMDLAYIYAVSSEDFWFYHPDYVNATYFKYISHRVALSFEFKF